MWLLLAALWGATAPAGASSILDEPIVIRADRAWEAKEGPDQEKSLNFEGNFEMSGRDWWVKADSAQVIGPLEEPDRIIVIGAPARISFTNDDGDITTGEGGRVIYWGTRQIVELQDNAVLQAGGVSITSSKIAYDLEARSLQSIGADGVEFLLGKDD